MSRASVGVVCCVVAGAETGMPEEMGVDEWGKGGKRLGRQRIKTEEIREIGALVPTSADLPCVCMTVCFAS